MLPWTRRLACVVLFAAAVGVVGRYVAPALFTSLGLDWWDLAELYRQAERERERRDELLRRDAVLMERLRNKARVGRAVARDGLPLLEAAAWFRRFNDGPSSPCGDADAEGLCRQVIGWAVVDAEGQGLDGAVVSARLEAELAAHLSRGPLALPE
jgi:hypothetical protein